MYAVGPLGDPLWGEWGDACVAPRYIRSTPWLRPGGILCLFVLLSPPQALYNPSVILLLEQLISGMDAVGSGRTRARDRGGWVAVYRL